MAVSQLDAPAGGFNIFISCRIYYWRYCRPSRILFQTAYRLPHKYDSMYCSWSQLKRGSYILYRPSR